MKGKENFSSPPPAVLVGIDGPGVPFRGLGGCRSGFLLGVGGGNTLDPHPNVSRGREESVKCRKWVME